MKQSEGKGFVKLNKKYELEAGASALCAIIKQGLYNNQSA